MLYFNYESDGNRDDESLQNNSTMSGIMTGFGGGGKTNQS